MPLSIQQALPEDFAALEQLLELYQYELSDIWLQDLDGRGRYGYDLNRHMQASDSRAYIARMDDQYAGFALTAPAMVTRNEGNWMEQFFVLKRYRRAGTGRLLARYVLSANPGLWEIGQIPGNTAAQAFWRKVIAEVTGGNFEEVQVTERWWQGVVQRFEVRVSA